jgi:hypothetical protein
MRLASDHHDHALATLPGHKRDVLLGQFGPRKRFGSDNMGEMFIRRDRLDECCVVCAFCFFGWLGIPLFCLFDGGNVISIGIWLNLEFEMR